ncbi:MAG: hypothetical protein ACXVRS_11235, partial [Gaiellaceae bacterium]
LLVSVFGEQWHIVEPLLRILAFYGLFRAFSDALAAFLNAIGRPAHPVLIQSAVLALALALLWPLSAYGARGIALAFTIGQGGGMLLSLYLAREAWSTALLFRLARPLAASVLATLGALAVRSIAPSDAGPLVTTLAFVVLVAALTFVLDPWARDVVRGVRRSPTASEAAE